MAWEHELHGMFYRRVRAPVDCPPVGFALNRAEDSAYHLVRFRNAELEPTGHHALPELAAMAELIESYVACQRAVNEVTQPE